MKVWLVTPAWGRERVTDVVLAQRAWLRGTLAQAGVELGCVVIADDENLDVARNHGFDTIEMENMLGAKINAGFAHAKRQGADWVSFVGSDDWLHPSMFVELAGQGVIAHRVTYQVDLARGKMRAVGCLGKYGGVPWFIRPASLPKDPLHPKQMRGIDLNIQLRLRRARWDVRSPVEGAPGGLVGFQSDNNMTPYGAGPTLGEEVDAWPVLRHWYPTELVDLAAQL